MSKVANYGLIILTAMIKEYQSIMKNDVWDVVPRQEGKSVVTSKWIYKIKHAVDSSIEQYKARFVARGFSQKEGKDYEETFALVARYTSIRSILSLAAVMKWKIHQVDVKFMFLRNCMWSSHSDLRHMIGRLIWEN